MSSNKKDKKDDKSGLGAILIVLAALASIGDALGGDAIFAIILIVVVIAVIVVGAKALKKNSAAAQQTASRESAPRREFVPEHFDFEKHIRKSKNSLSKRLTEEMRDDLSKCDDDHEHEPVKRLSAEEKRERQLKDFLRSGIIEREEYDILMRKFGLKD